ncbi:MAG TPA: EVE domain-containing protein [Gammaproteobacteria bacterium]|nr:EVE domain-containing protein [Gammaproteobacteria bacterium]
MRYWLMKSEPDTFSIDDLARRPAQIEPWDGVRNYQARNMMRDEMKRGDLVFFYHSNCQPPGIVGTMKVHREGYPDDTAFDPNDPHFDPKSDPDKPRWFRVDVKFVSKFKHKVTLDDLRSHPELSEMAVVRRGNRLSITPVSEDEWHCIMKLAKGVSEDN